MLIFNPYGIIAVNPKRHRDVNHNGALALIKWITSKSAQKRINDFNIDGQRLFTPMLDSSYFDDINGEL